MYRIRHLLGDMDHEQEEEREKMSEPAGTVMAFDSEDEEDEEDEEEEGVVVCDDE